MELLRRGEIDPAYRGMATTLTLYLGVWPRAYLLQVGDSRCYLLRNGELSQITRDQTMAQELIDLGVMISGRCGQHPAGPHAFELDRWTPDARRRSPGSMSTWGNVVLLCSDGLTNHVSDERIRDRLRSMTSAQQVCEDLLEEALAGGGTDNITLIVARAVARES